MDGKRSSDSDVAHNLTITALLVFLPSFLLSIFSTLNFRDLSSLKILYRQPSLIILPTVTYFTFSRDNIGCCRINNRVSFSKKFTWLNIVVSTVSYLIWGEVSLIGNFEHILVFLIFALPLPLLLTGLFLHTDKLCCCCCTSRDQLSVYDPGLDKRFIMVDGEALDPEDDVETPNDDGETGNNT